MSPPAPSIDPNERLGRDVVSERREKDARRGTIRTDIFESGTDSLSVDRVDQGPRDAMLQIAEAKAAAREKPFLGWAVVKCSDAEHNGRSVEASPTFDNPHHADIHLNIAEESELKELRRAHALELAANAIWLGRQQYLEND